MTEKITISRQDIDDTYRKLKEDAESGGYFLNPDSEFTKDLVRSLLFNEKRYGYWACPCRLASGKRDRDLDIICPCDYRDPDLNEFGCCYCSLYVSFKNFKEKKYTRIPDRRNKIKKSDDIPINIKGEKMETENKLPIWRCKVCGYLCAREEPPEKCPICGVDKDRFERFEL